MDKDRILAKIDELDGYLKELEQIVPASFEEYKKIEKKRGSERVLQLCVECALDICSLFVSGLRLGLPTEENDLFNKMKKRGLISDDMPFLLKKMRGVRNILIHEYAIIDDKIVYGILKTQSKDFEKVRKEFIDGLKKAQG